MLNKRKEFQQVLLRSMKRPQFRKALFLIAGLSSTLWFLIRVIPKPSRASYPCMKASAPIMSAFVIYLLTFFGSVTAFRVAQRQFNKAKYLYSFVFLVLALLISGIFYFGNPEKMYAGTVNRLTTLTTSPIGVAKGIFPGRVSWAHNPNAAHWDGKSGFWWDDKNNPQNETDKLLTASICNLTGKKNESEAWNALFKYFNQEKKHKNAGYTANEKIAIKINQNNTDSHANTNEINASPQLILSLLKSLINVAGIPQKNITVFDASRFITDNIFNKCHLVFPDVQFVDNVGGDGRIKANYIDNAIPYSVNNGKVARGLASCAVEADYLINMAILKGHVGGGVTLCGKNYYGCTNIFSDWRLNAHDNFSVSKTGKPQYLTFVDFLGHKDLGNKTMLFLIDGIYGCKFVNGIPKFKMEMAPFNKNWPCSLFASLDPVAIDAVGTDFIVNEWPDAPDLKDCEQYLIESALANQPPSGTKYDPERDGTGLQSLGVFEHWNNAVDKKYSRNLKTAKGIELIYKHVE